MRILLISHTCQSRTEGQPRAVQLSRCPEIHLRVIVPDRWRHYGKWRAAEPPDRAAYQYQVSKVLWPSAGPAQFYLHWYPALAGILREFRPDVIDLWEEPWALVSAHTCWLRNRIMPSASIVAETEQNILKSLPPPFEWFRSYTLRQADFAVGRNSQSVEVLRAKGYTGPAEVVPNAVDTDLFHPMDRAECRNVYNISHFTVGYVGRLVEEKGLSDLIQSLLHCGSDIRLLLVGSGPMKGALEQQAAALGLSGRVTFLPARPLEDLPRLMNAIDCLVLPSRTTPSWKEQFGRVIIEAHACGIPVVGSDSGAIPEVVGNGGLITPERSPAALGVAFETLKRNPSLAERMGGFGLQQAHARYTWERVAERMESIYRTLMHSDRTRQDKRTH